MNKNVLAVIAHPRGEESLNAALLESTRRASEATGASLIINDLYEKNFDPVLSREDLAGVLGQAPLKADVQNEQKLIAAADLIVIHHPVFWFDRPAILKGWFDRVFTSGFAFVTEADGVRGLLKGKQARVIQTAGTPPEFYASLEADQYPQTAIERGTLGFCGLEARTLTHYNVFAVDQSQREEMIAATHRFVLEALTN